MSAAPGLAGKWRRAPILVLLAVALLAGVLAGRAHSPRAAVPTAPTDAAVMPAKAALSAAWYCPGWPKSIPMKGQTITLTNLGASASNAVVTVQPDTGAAPLAKTVAVPGDSVITLDRATLTVVTLRTQGTTALPPKLPYPDGPVVVEPFSPDVVVSMGLQIDTALDSMQCATAAAPDWYLAAGTTVRGVSQWLVLDDPFSADARVDVTLWTDSGQIVLPSLQGIDVSGRSRVIVAVHDSAVRQPRVAVQVHASIGQVVVAQTLVFSPASGPPGVATSLGAFAPSGSWWFSDGDARPGAAQWVAIADTGRIDAHVSVQGFLDSKAVVAPVVLTVGSGAVSWVQIGGCGSGPTPCLHVADGARFGIKVQADAGVPIVAATLSRFGSSAAPGGAVTSPGSTAPAKQWIFPRTRVKGELSTSISLLNATADVAHVSVEIVHGGHADQPATINRLTIASGQLLVLPRHAIAVLPLADAAAVVSSDVPLFTESTIYAPRDAVRSPGVKGR